MKAFVKAFRGGNKKKGKFSAQMLYQEDHTLRQNLLRCFYFATLEA